MITEKSENFQHLEDKVTLILSRLKLQEDFKFLLSQVSHDLASPLGYLKFSANILMSQLESNANSDLKETANVVSASTSKLNEEAKEIVEKGKSKMKTLTTSSKVSEVLVASLRLCKNNSLLNIIEGNIYAKLNYDHHLYVFVVSFIISEIENLKLKLKNIQVKKIDKHISIQFNFFEIENSKLEELRQEILTKQTKQKLSKVFYYLKSEITFEDKTLKLVII